MANKCKYYKEEEVISYDNGATFTPTGQIRKGDLYEQDSPSCNNIDEKFKWEDIANGYICDGQDKYTKQIRLVSYDNEFSWYPYMPVTYRKDVLVEEDSPFCDNKWNGQYVISGITGPSSDNPCGAGYVKIGDDCVPVECPEGQIYWIDGCVSTECPDGQTWEAGECTANCPKWYVWNGVRCVYVDPVKNVKCNETSTLTRDDVTYNDQNLDFKMSVRAGTVGECVSSIGAGCFSGTSLTNIQLNDGLEKIENSAFRGTQIQSINIPASVEVIENLAFAYSQLSSITFDSGSTISGISNYCFEDSRLREIDIPASVKSIGSSAFMNCIYLSGVTFEDDSQLMTIGVDAFRNSVIHSISLPASLRTISQRAFQSAAALTSVEFHPDSDVEIQVYGFYNTGIESLTINKGIKSLAGEAFGNCPISSVTITNDSRFKTLPAANVIYYDNIREIYYGSGVTSVSAQGNGVQSPVLEKVVVDPDNPLFYSIDDKYMIRRSDNVLVLGCGGDVVIPAVVTGIADNAFYYRKNITSISFASQSNLTWIGNRAFALTSIKSIALPSSLETISGYAFYNCTSLSSITISSSGVTSIGNYAFYNCSALNGFNIPSTVTNIGQNAFAGCSGMTGITIPDGVEAISSSTFIDCTSLSGLTIGSGCTLIGSSAFTNCPIDSFTIRAVNPPTLNRENSNSYSGLRSYITAYVPCDGYFDYSSSSGYWNYFIISPIDESCKETEWKFKEMICRNNNINEIQEAHKIIDGVDFGGTGEYRTLSESWGDCSTYNSRYELTYKITSGSTPNRSVSSTNNYMRKYTLFESNDSGFTSADYAISDYQNTNLIYNDFAFEPADGGYYYQAKKGYYGHHYPFNFRLSADTQVGVSAITQPIIIKCEVEPTKIKRVSPSTTNYVASNNFLTDAVINNTYTIPDGQFSGCTALTGLTIPNYVGEIGSYAFSGCTSLANISIEDTRVKSIGGYAFAGCPITEITIPSACTSVGYNAFYNSPSLSSITFNGETPPTISSSQFSGLSQNYIVKVPCGKIFDYYDAGFDYYAYYPHVVQDDSCSDFGMMRFKVGEYGRYYVRQNAESATTSSSITKTRSGFTEIEVSNTVKTIGDKTFTGCSNVTAITIGNNVETIGQYAFSGMTSLTSIDVPDSVTSIGNGAFDSCRSLSSATIGSGCTVMRSSPFANSTASTRVLTMKSAIPPALNSSSINATVIYVPCGCADRYKVTNNWSYSASIIQEMPGCTIAETRWVDVGYTCESGETYMKQQEQYRYSGYSEWYDSGNYRTTGTSQGACDFTELEWLQFYQPNWYPQGQSYTSYTGRIHDLGITPSKNMKIEMKMIASDCKHGSGYGSILTEYQHDGIFDMYVSGSTPYLVGDYEPGDTYYHTYTGTSIASSTPSIVEVTWNNIIVNYNYGENYSSTTCNDCKLFGESIGLFDNTSSNYDWSTRRIYLYGSNNVKIYYIKVYESGTLVKHLVPVRMTSTNIVTLYDMINGTFCTVDSGSFKGSDE